jgi:arylsulfatase
MLKFLPAPYLLEPMAPGGTKGAAPWALGWLTIALCAACAPNPRNGQGRGVLVIAMDALRADHLSCAGYDRETTPTLDALAAEGVRFERAYGAAPWVVPAHVAILTGCDPLLAKRMVPPDVPVSLLTQWHIPSDAPHVAKEFLRQGYTTAAFSDHVLLAPAYGFASGFETFQAFEPSPSGGWFDHGVEGVGRRFEQWVRNRGRSTNWFAYLELNDLERTWTRTDPTWDSYFEPRRALDHVPPVGEGPQLFFAVPRTKWSGGIASIAEYEARYDGTLRRVDKVLGHLFTRLKRMGRYDDTTIVVVGAYGLSFGESGMILDSGTFSDVDLHVPLIVKPARFFTFEPGTRQALVSSVDLAPTLLEICGLNSSVATHGKSLATLLARAGGSVRDRAYASCALQDGYAVIDERFCYERTWPARVLDRRLADSWYGGAPQSEEDSREALHDREHEIFPGHREEPVGPSSDLARLRAAGEEWRGLVEQDRARLQRASALFASKSRAAPRDAPEAGR